MDYSLVDSFARRLDSICPLPVQAVHDTAFLAPSEHIYICATSCSFSRDRGNICLEKDSPLTPSYNPSIDHLFHSAVPLASHLPTLAVLMTGIGDDGARGLLSLRNAGASTVAESEESAIVYGMPRAAKEMQAAQSIQNLDGIIRTISHFGEHHVLLA